MCVGYNADYRQWQRLGFARQQHDLAQRILIRPIQLCKRFADYYAPGSFVSVSARVKTRPRVNCMPVVLK